MECSIRTRAATSGSTAGSASADRFRLWPLPASEEPLAVRCGECPYLFRLDPSSPEVGALGLRDRDPRPPGEGLRVLVLGDSVVHGGPVAMADRFTDRLEAGLADTHPGLQVINAGVPGYSTYNQRTWYRAEGRSMEPDLVLLVVCLNDVTDPLLHWSFLGHRRWSEWAAADREIPAAAVPDPDYHREHVVAPLRQRRLSLWARDHLAIARGAGLGRHWAGPLGGATRPHRRSVGVDGRTWPAQLTTEDELPITTWTDAGSPAWSWFQEQVATLADETSADGAPLALVVAPLAYQLDGDYPILPQQRIGALAAELDLPYLDLLPTLRAHGGEAPFLPGDDWHLSAAGHALAADALADLVGQLLADQSVSTGEGIRSEE